MSFAAGSRRPVSRPARKKAEINAEIAAKEKALKVHQDEERRQERASVFGQALSAAGRPDLAERLTQTERTRQLRGQYAGNPEMLRVVSLLDEAERVQYEARENWIPQEVQRRPYRWDTSIPSGYDNPQQAIRDVLLRIESNLGRALANLHLFDISEV